MDFTLFLVAIFRFHAPQPRAHSDQRPGLRARNAHTTYTLRCASSLSADSTLPRIHTAQRSTRAPLCAGCLPGDRLASTQERPFFPHEHDRTSRELPLSSSGRRRRSGLTAGTGCNSCWLTFIMIVSRDPGTCAPHATAAEPGLCFAASSSTFVLSCFEARHPIALLCLSARRRTRSRSIVAGAALTSVATPLRSCWRKNRAGTDLQIGTLPPVSHDLRS